MVTDRNRIIRQEADAWRREGQISAEFHRWIERSYPLGADTRTARTLQTVLLSVAGVMVLVGIFTLVSQFWDRLARPEKFGVLCGFALLSLALGWGAQSHRSTRPLAHVLLPLALPLYLFAMGYLQADEWTGDANILTPIELGAVVLGFGAGVAALVAGLARWPTLAMAGPVAAVFALEQLENFAAPSVRLAQTIHLLAFAAVAAMHAALLLLWAGRLPWKAWTPLSARLALAANVPWGFASLVMIVHDFGWDHHATPYPQMRYDTTVVGVLATALYLAILLGFSLRLALPELTGTAGLFLVGDAVWLGGSKGGFLGAVIAIFAAAVVLAILAQQGLLLRILRPRAPVSSAPVRAVEAPTSRPSRAADGPGGVKKPPKG